MIMNWKYILIVVILIVIVGGSAFWTVQMSQKKPESKFPVSSVLSEFVETVSRVYKPSTGDGGILPEPPRAQIKKAEGYLKERVESTIKVTYAFIDYVLEPPLTHSLVVYAAFDPFRWRADFFMNFEKGEYKSMYLYDGSAYSSCSTSKTAPPDCYRASQTFLEKELQTPLPLNEFLNDVLDPLTLKKFVAETKESKQAQVQEDTRTIATFSADCKVVDDTYSTLDFCIAKDTNLLLHLDVKRKTSSGSILRHFTLTAQSVDFSPLPKEVFTSP